MKNNKNNVPQINLEDDDFGAILNCAVRYALGRQSYMPGLVIDYIRPLLPYLNDKTLWCLERDIREAENFGGYGDPQIDKPGWIKFLLEIQEEIQKRKEDNV